MEVQSQEQILLDVPDQVDNIYPIIKEIEELGIKTNPFNICFFLQSNFSEDVKIQSNLSYFNYTYDVFVNYTVQQIQGLYDKGYRIFIGPNTSSRLKLFLPFFESHPDTVCISLTSSSADPVLVNRTTKNVYRLTPNDSTVIPIYTDFVLNGPSPTGQGTGVQFLRYNLFQQDGDNFSINLCSALQSSLNSYPYLTGALYNITNAASLQNAFTNSGATGSSTAINVMALTDDSLIQQFYNSISPSNLAYYIENVSSSPPALASSLSGYYNFLSFNPPFERNIQKQIDDLGLTNSSLLLLDSVNIARSFQQNNALTNNVIGSYGYLYFNATGDRSFKYFTIATLSGTAWPITRLYNLSTEQVPQEMKSAPYTVL